MTIGIGTRSLIPDAPLDGYGFDPDYPSSPGSFLILPAFPLLGHAYREVGYPSPAVVRIEIGASEFPTQLRRLLIWQATYDAIIGGIGRAGGTPAPNPQFLFRWRVTGGSGSYTDVPGATLGISLSTVESTVTEGARVVGQVIVEDRRVDPTSTDYDVSAPDLPAEDDIVEFYLIGPVAPDQDHEVYIDSATVLGGVSAGQFAKNVYDGLYSARGPNGEIVPTGVRYDEDALLALTTPVRLRLREPLEDARAILERRIYAPLGYAPALDPHGVIAPVSQVPPADTAGLPVIYDGICEPSPDWNAGERIINVVRFTYPRDYAAGSPDPKPPNANGEMRPDIIEARDVVVEFRDEVSIARHGEKILELDGSFFAAIGRPAETAEEATLEPDASPILRPRDHERRKRRVGARVDAPLTESPVINQAAHIIPISGDVQNEVGWQLAQDRGSYLLQRYSMGAPTMRLLVARAGLPADFRVGDWVLLQLSWLPDYITQRRGLVGLAQVVALADADCAHVRLTVEQVFEGEGS